MLVTRSRYPASRPDGIKDKLLAMGNELFSYRITKDNRILIWWHGANGKREIVLKGARAKKLIRELPTMDPELRQLVLARATGKFKRGNERRAR